MDIVSLSDFLATEAGHGHTLQEICRHFGVSEASAYRGIRSLESAQHIDLHRAWRGHNRVYRVIRRSAFEGRSFPRAKTLSVIELRLAAKALEVHGCQMLAMRLATHVEHLMRDMALAHRKAVEHQVAHLLNHVDIKEGCGMDPIPWNQTVEDLHLAILGGRTIELSLSERSVKGKVSRIHYAGNGASEVRLEDGTTAPLKEIKAVAGVHDLKLRLL